jgi:hypothetical protein
VPWRACRAPRQGSPTDLGDVFPRGPRAVHPVREQVPTGPQFARSHVGDRHRPHEVGVGGRERLASAATSATAWRPSGSGCWSAILTALSAAGYVWLDMPRKSQSPARLPWVFRGRSARRTGSNRRWHPAKLPSGPPNPFSMHASLPGGFAPERAASGTRCLFGRHSTAHRP